MAIAIRRATTSDLDDLAPLFDAYRQFYGQPFDPGLARSFLTQRLTAGDSVVFLALDHGRPEGFTQLYPSFTSLGCARIFVLNDLFVTEQARGRSVGPALLEAAAGFARSQDAVRLTLSTGVGNVLAQGVYEKAGWIRSDGYLTYTLAL